MFKGFHMFMNSECSKTTVGNYGDFMMCTAFVNCCKKTIALSQKKLKVRLLKSKCAICYLNDDNSDILVLP